jgi:WD40 repeat protein/DNA-binding winged helix-turn-helix (wHTH) protein
MLVMQQFQPDSGRSFRVGAWLVQPEQNRLSDGVETVQLEPRVMDLLVYLADHAGEVVSRREILDSVWQQEFVSDTTLSAAVAVLRRTLADDARNPRYIETIAKRGYRMVAEIADPEAVATVTPFPGLVLPRERSPYPGLAAFTAADANLFFGREEEAQALWARIHQQPMLAVIGPSGVGKSSFVRAGVIPAAPDGWGTVVLTPGEAPLRSLAMALAPEFADDAEGVRQLLAGDDPDVALSLASRWRERWDEVLLVVDQFEELFTLVPAADRIALTDLLARLARAAGVHVLLVLRDDFLYACHEHAGLAPVFEGLTALAMLDREGLQRAAVEPARRMGYHFEDGLVEDLIDAVAGERGAMPLAAFALLRLWQLRDREHKLITRQAFETIGGISGALAQHAEEVLRSIGDDQQRLVREIFRNLVTAQGTRALREVDDLLSVFPEDQRAAAEEVLGELITGRLLTTFELDGSTNDAEAPSPRVEIVHESLLGAWPRLVRWQTQDADTAQLRDQVRQAARLWASRGRSRDLLWTGAACRELLVWSESYPGGLSTVEQAFVQAVESHAGRRRRRRRLAVAILFLAVVGAAAAVTGLWRQSEHHARRAEARRLYHVGANWLEQSPPTALAYAIASLELGDDPQVRRLARVALARGPTPIVVNQVQVPDPALVVSASFSPDGRWLAAGHFDGSIRLWPASGGEPRVWRSFVLRNAVYFSPDSSVLVSSGSGSRKIGFWSVPDARLVATTEREGEFPEDMDPRGANNLRRLKHIVPGRGPDCPWAVDMQVFETWSQLPGQPRAALSPDGKRLVYARGAELWEVLVAQDPGESIRLGQAPAALEHLVYHPDGRRLASFDVEGGACLWSLADGGAEPLRRWQGPRDDVCDDLAFAPSGDAIVAAFDGGYGLVWRLDDPPGADPLRLAPNGNRMIGLGFHPSGRWLATASLLRLTLWPLERPDCPVVLRGHSSNVDDVEFSADGRFLVSSGTDGTVRRWPLHHGPGAGPEVLYDWGRQIEGHVDSIALSPNGRFVVAAAGQTSVRLLPVDGSPTTSLGGFEQRVLRAAVGPESRLVAVPGVVSGRRVVRVWDLETGAVTDVDVEQVLDRGFMGEVAFAPDGRLLASGEGIVAAWEPGLQAGTILREHVGQFRLSADASKLISRPHSDGTPGMATIHDLVTGTEVPLESHGKRVIAVALDPTGDVAVTVSGDGVVRVGRATGEAPHHLYGPPSVAVDVSPDGRWIATGSGDGTIRLWPMPDLDRQPLHELPRAGFVEHLKAATNLRVVVDDEHPNGHVVALTGVPLWE